MPHQVGTVDELRGEGCRVITVHGRRIGVVSAGEDFFAFRDRCPHKGASLCEGRIGGTFVPSAPHEYVFGMDGQVIRCPWHGWEFDLRSGRSLLEPHRGVKVYPVTVEDDIVFLHA